jgi:hypothetical protein
MLLLPFVIAVVFALWVLLLPVAIVQRYRMGRARRRVQPFFVRANAWLTALSAVLFVLGAWLLQGWVIDAVRDAVAGIAIGVALGWIGLRFDRFEWTDRGLFRTPHRGFLLLLTGVLAARVLVGLLLAWQALPGDGWGGWLDRGGLLGVAGVLLGHALATTWGLRARIARHASGR